MAPGCGAPVSEGGAPVVPTSSPEAKTWDRELTDARLLLLSVNEIPPTKPSWSFKVSLLPPISEVSRDEPTVSFNPFCITSIGRRDCVVSEPVVVGLIVFSFVALEIVDGTEADVPFLGRAFAFG